MFGCSIPTDMDGEPVDILETKDRREPLAFDDKTGSYSEEGNVRTRLEDLGYLK
jgi:hypothetical protein